jgi:hypothetical protein
LAKDEEQGAGSERQAEVNGAVDDEEGLVSSLDGVANFFDRGRFYF